MTRRPELLSSVVLRQNPHNVAEVSCFVFKFLVYGWSLGSMQHMMCAVLQQQNPHNMAALSRFIVTVLCVVS